MAINGEAASIDARGGDIAILVPADLGEGRPVPPAVARGLAI